MSEFENQNPEDLTEKLLARIHFLEEAVNALGYSNKAAKKNRFPTKTQPSVVYGLSRAVCVETIDPWKENRVRFYHPMLHDPEAPVLSLPFASPVSSMGGFDDCGLNWVPPAGSTIVVFFENGSLDSPFYIGTTWHRFRGPGGSSLLEVFPSREYQSIHKGHRKGYLVGADDESQVLPPWNTESYNGYDIDDINDFTDDPDEQKRTTYPNIYGFKTPEKHMLKMVDGNAKCNHRWKRVELGTGCGNWMIFKDDHLHYGGQWSHPECPPPAKSTNSLEFCSSHTGNLPYFTDFQGTPVEKDADCNGKAQSSNILGGHSSTPKDPSTKHSEVQTGANKFFKHKNECRPYKGPGTPQNNRCQLPQSGIQFLSIAGHTWGMDDSVEEPRGKPSWERSMENFDFGCNDKFLGVMWLKSATGHGITLSDIEEETNLRGKKNYLQLKSASGNRIELNDHTIGQSTEAGSSCPPNIAGPERGITLESTSKHTIKMIDHLNEQCSPARKEGGVPVAKATRGYIQIRSGYGLEMRFNDDFSQQQTQQQWIQITHPQCINPNEDDNCNSCDSSDCRGPHFLRFQGRAKGVPGIIFLRAGGHSVRQTYDMDIVLVGDKERNPSDKFTYVSRKRISSVEDVDYRYTKELHILFAEKQILLQAGRDCPPNPLVDQDGVLQCKGPCLYGVVVARCPTRCPLTGITHWTERSVSERVFASAYHPCQVDSSCPDAGDCGTYFELMAQAADPPCPTKKDEQDIDTGNGVLTVNTNTQTGNTG
jgi:hypothetical protein